MVSSQPSLRSMVHETGLEWFSLSNKDKYCGEVYLELTFWSNVSSLSLQTHYKPKSICRRNLQRNVLHLKLPRSTHSMEDQGRSLHPPRFLLCLNMVVATRILQVPPEYPQATDPMFLYHLPSDRPALWPKLASTRHLMRSTNAMVTMPWIN